MINSSMKDDYMENDEQEKKSIPPYLSYKTFRNFTESLKVGIPSRIDKSLMITMSGVVQSQVLAALKFLDLIDASGTPTDKLVRLVNLEGNEKKKVLRDVLHSSYKFIFSNGFDLAATTSKHLEEQFAKTGTTGDTTRKCFVFFIGMAKDAGINLSPHIQQKKRGPRGSGKTPKPKKQNPKNEIDDSPKNPPTNSTSAMSWNQMLLSKFPSFDPAWPAEVQGKWFDSFEKLMKAQQAEKAKEG